MNLKDYQEKPADGLFEKIQRRMAVRRALSMGGFATAIVVVVAATLLLQPRIEENEVAVGTLSNVEPVVDVQVAPAVDLTSPAAVTVGNTDSAVLQPVGTVIAMPIDTTADDHEYLAAMLPQGLPEVAKLNEAAAEEQSMSTSVSIGTVDSAPSTVPDVIIPSTKTDKSGQPVPHYDNVIWAPNLIVPDGDVDENRRFSIKATSDISNFKIHIYNRNGRRIYLATDPSFAWDATMDGVRVPQGAYVWVATFRDSDGNPRQEQGTVTVIR